MGVDVRGTVKGGIFSAPVAVPDGTELEGQLTEGPKRKTIHEMSQQEFDVWLDQIAGSCPDLEEPPDYPPKPLDWSWDDE